MTIGNQITSRVHPSLLIINEDATSLVGRDGQEIDESAGVRLCELVDEQARNSDDAGAAGCYQVGRTFV